MKWCEEDIEKLKYMYTHGVKVSVIAKELNRSVWAIKSKAQKLNILSPLMCKIQNGKCFCPGCKLYKELDEFGSHKSKNRPTEIRTYCRECEAILNKTKKHKEKESQEKEIIIKKVETSDVIDIIKQMKKVREKDTDLLLKEEFHGSETKMCCHCKKEYSLSEFCWNKIGKKISARCYDCRKLLREKSIGKKILRDGFEY